MLNKNQSCLWQFTDVFIALIDSLKDSFIYLTVSTQFLPPTLWPHMFNLNFKTATFCHSFSTLSNCKDERLMGKDTYRILNCANFYQLKANIRSIPKHTQCCTKHIYQTARSAGAGAERGLLTNYENTIPGPFDSIVHFGKKAF